MPLRSIGTVLPAAFATATFGRTEFEATAQIADEAFDSLWAPDHLLWHFPVLDPFVTLGSVALLTRKVRLGFGVVNVAIRPVPEMAKMVASLDHLSEGRIVLGIGVGGEMAEEFALAGVSRAGRDAAADAAIAGFRQFFDGSAVPRLEPLPPQSSSLPIWVGGRSGRALDRAATHADGWYGAFLSPRGFRQRRTIVEECRTAAGREGSEFAFAHHLAVCLGDDSESKLAKFFGRLPTYDHELFRKYWIAGSADDAVARIAAYVEAGVEHVVLAPPGPDFVAQLDRIACDLVPKLREAFGPEDGTVPTSAPSEAVAQ